MNIKQAYKIKKIDMNEQEKVISFMMKIRAEIFPMLDADEVPKDLLQFEKYYMGQDDGAIFAAISNDGDILGTIGVQLYDDRFQQLQSFYGHLKTAEIVKCYIDPEQRRSGIGTMLFAHVKHFCYEADYEMLYLHTHLFLPGAATFWEAQGFKRRLAEDDSIWQTLHMDMKL